MIQKNKKGFSATATDIAAATDGRLYGEAAAIIRGVTSDSREVRPGMLFVARRGDDLDGHAFVNAAISAGALLCMVEHDWAESDVGVQTISENPSTSFNSVSDTTQALGVLAHWWRRELAIPVIAVTGSNGKTTTKEMMSHVLTRVVGEGTSNLKSFNNHVGLPQTILSASRSDAWLLLEAGMNHPGELSYLGSIAEPDVAVVLNVGPAHLEYFSSLADIADAKVELVSQVRDGGTAVISGDDAQIFPAIERLRERDVVNFELRTFGQSDTPRVKLHYRAKNITERGEDGIEFMVAAKSETAMVKIPHCGSHNVDNALACIAAVHQAFRKIPLKDIANALRDAPLPPMRFQRIKLGPFTVINDAYNANPISMAGAIRTVSSIYGPKKFAVVIGDMLELGEEADSFHREIGALAASCGAEPIVAIGDKAAQVVAGAKKAGAQKAYVAEGHAQAVDLLVHDVTPDTQAVLFKGSRGMALERVIEELEKRFDALPPSLSA